jgi:hypothetical protein
MNVTDGDGAAEALLSPRFRRWPQPLKSDASVPHCQGSCREAPQVPHIHVDGSPMPLDRRPKLLRSGVMSPSVPSTEESKIDIRIVSFHFLRLSVNERTSMLD